MSIEVRVPTLPESVTDATVLTWHRKVGEFVKRDENLVDLETDKVVLEVPSPVDGILAEISSSEGDVVNTDEVLAHISEQSVHATEAVASDATPDSKEDHTSTATDPVLTPAVRRLVKELDLDPSTIKGTGKDGRILKSDLMQYLDQKQIQQDPDIIKTDATGQTVDSRNRTEQRVAMTRLRARIAERLIEAQQNAAILTTFNEVNLAAIKELRSRHQKQFEKEYGVRLGFMSFFVKTVVEALKKFPVVNASVDGHEIVYHGYYDIGIAVGSPRGLVVPILRDADQMSYGEIEIAIKAFGRKAQDGALTYDELTGGTFTLSNGGIYGSMMSTPILNPPQSAILGMHNITQRPVVENGEIVIRPMMYLALSYDHRIIDGREAVQFLVSIKEGLEDPAKLLLQI